MDRYSYAHSVDLVYSGESYFRILIDMIRNSEESLHLQTYIFELDQTGNNILRELERAAARGVKIYFLADGYGSKAITSKDIAAINRKGINFRLFSTFFSSESIYPGRRLHHKIVVADEKTALIGGINIADKYRGSETTAPWLDYAVLVKGNICLQLHQLCESFYHKKRSAITKITRSENENVRLRFISNDWAKGKNQIHKSYRNALYNAKHSVTFIASYFLPGYRFRKAIKRAKKRGIDVKIILARKTDMPFLFYAEKYFYPFFLENGIKIYEWKNSVMHAKAVLIDDNYVNIGSYNLNPVSHYLSIELNAEIRDKQFSEVFRGHVNTILTDSCIEITKTTNPYANSWLAKTRNSLLYYFFKFIFLVFISRKR